MTKKDTKKSNAKARAAKKSPQQTKIAGTERIDANPKIEKQAEISRVADEAAAEMVREADEERDKLTAVMVAEGKTAHIYEGEDGKKHKAFVPSAKALKAKVVTIKPKKNLKKTANDSGDE